MLADLPPVTFRVVLVDFPVFFVPGLLVRPVAKRLIRRKTTQADPDRLLLRLDFQRSLGGFKDIAHNLMVKIE